MNPVLRIGARASPLSMTQARWVQRLLAGALGVDPARIPITPLTTTGDRITDRRLLEAGGKGLFTKELDEALLEGRVDLCVHSMKDVPTLLPDGIILAVTPQREDPRDAFIARDVTRFEALPEGAVLGTASLRRAAQALHVRPDLKIVTLRGNVETRLAKIADGGADATFLGMAGLNRLGLAHCATAAMDVAQMLPAVGQGALAITARAGDGATLAGLATLNDKSCEIETAAERAFLAALDGSCRTSIAALGRYDGAQLIVLGEALSPDGAHRWRRDAIVPQQAEMVAAAIAAGARMGAEIRAEAGALLVQD